MSWCANKLAENLLKMNEACAKQFILQKKHPLKGYFLGSDKILNSILFFWTNSGVRLLHGQTARQTDRRHRSVSATMGGCLWCTKGEPENKTNPSDTGLSSHPFPYWRDTGHQGRPIKVIWLRKVSSHWGRGNIHHVWALLHFKWPRGGFFRSHCSNWLF